jgi:nucleoside 2-deoxyribosyltransferase
MKDFMKKTIYFAGPHLFGIDYEIYARHVTRKYKNTGIVLAMPGDGGARRSGQIYQTNLGLIDECDGVIADLNPFRSEIEPDSGTAFECGYAAALGKPIIAIVEDRRSQVQKMQGSSLGCIESDGTYRSDEGDLIEDFDLPVNLMLFHSLEAVVSTLDEAIQYFDQKPGKTRG